MSGQEYSKSPSRTTGKSLSLLPSRLTASLRQLITATSKRRAGIRAAVESRRSLMTTVAILRAQQEATLDGILVVNPEGAVLFHNRRFRELWNIPEEVVARGSDEELLGHAFRLVQDWDSFIARVKDLYDHPTEVSKDVIELRDGRTLSRTSVPVIDGNGQMTGRAWYFTDITEMRRAQKLQDALFQIATISRTASDLDELYAALHQVVGSLMDATNFFIARTDEASGKLVLPYFVDEVDEKPESLDPTRGLSGYVYSTGEPLLATPERFAELIRSGQVEQIGAPSVDWLGVPLKSGERTFGVLGIQSYREEVRFGEREKAILTFVSQHISAAIEQQQRSEAVRESERRYRQMFEGNQAVQLLIDPETGAIVDANRAASEFYGYDRVTLKTMKIGDINPLAPGELEQEMSRAANQSRSYFVFRHRLANRELRDVEVHSSPVEVRGRKLLYSIIHDITERRRAEEALRRSETKFRNIFDFAPVGIYQATRKGRLLAANKTLATILGYDSVEDLFSLDLEKDVYYDPSQREALVGRFEPGRSAADLELQWRKKNGEPVWVQMTAHAVRNPHSPVHYEGFVFDITQRRAAEAMLRNQSAAISASVDGVALVDDRGVFTYLNDAHARLHGYEPDALLGQSWEVLYSREEAERFRTDIMPAFLRGGHWVGAAVGTRADGTTFTQEISLTLLDNGGFTSVVRDTTERTYAEEQIKHLAYHDALTGLPNRLLFKDRLQVAAGLAHRSRAMLAVLFLDLDRFKSINDSLGHNAGDHLLQSVTARIHSCLRESDTVARQGGDEFTILLPSLAHSEDAARIAEKILQSIRAPFHLEGRELYITTSIGISLFPDDGADADTLIKNADTAMYQAKEQGRDNYQLFNAAINARALLRLALENDLRGALSRNEFVIYYQPIFDFHVAAISGTEALLRWQHPRLGLLPPADFIPLAESCGLMVPIGRWALRAACEQAVEWKKAGLGDLSLAVNLSVAQLQSTQLLEQVSAIVTGSGIDPAMLELEITESSAMQNPEQSARMLRELKRMGLRVSLDDFGTGHSSLSYLKRFPIDTLKIDQSFIRDIIADENTAAIVKAIITMAHSLRLKVVAEGVELPDQREFLELNACDQMQGFLLARPLAAPELERLVRESNSVAGSR